MSETMANRLREQAERAKTALANIKEASAEITQSVVETSETIGAAGLVGMLKGYLGKSDVMGVPIELAAGGALLALGAFGVGGASMTPHFVAMGRGPLASYAAQFGESFGRSLASKKAPAAKGEFPAAASGAEMDEANRWRQNIEGAAAA